MRGQPAPDAAGLTSAEAARRLASFGPNALPPPRRDPLPARVVHQLAEPMSLLLVAAATISGVWLDEVVEAAAIVVIVLLNAVIALVQEGRASRALEALRSLETPSATVHRDGHDLVVPAGEVVPGDLVRLAAGDRVPADLALVATSSLEVDESALTGESLPVRKTAGATDAGTGIADRPGTAWSGTLVTRGTARGEVVATGADTALGRIAVELRERRPPTPLQRELAGATRRLGAAAIVISVVVFGILLLRATSVAEGLHDAFLSAVALAVAAVPEGLATVTTVALALGVRRMAQHGAIIRRLSAVETLGCTTVIAFDKTGTVTENRMQVDLLVTSAGRARDLADLPPPLRERVTDVLALCNDAELDPASGDPMEIALLEALPDGILARRRTSQPRLADEPFDEARRRMTTAHATSGKVVLLTKGAPEAVLPRCTRELAPDGTEVPLDNDRAAALARTARQCAESGARMLALAFREVEAVPDPVHAAEQEETLVALVGLRDPVRAQAPSAIAAARAAGVDLIMITGDHPGTARAVAEEAGLVTPPDTGADTRTPAGTVVTGDEVRDAGYPADVLHVPVYARFEPGQKLELVRELHARDHVVAMTGDGVNDAPALRHADIGVALGARGTEVAREAGDMVITDDDLATIVTAIREGRGIYDNIRKVVEYLVAANIAEILVVLGALLVAPALGTPLLPLQLLWINLLTDGLPALALGVDPIDEALMRRGPRDRRRGLLSGPRLRRLGVRGLVLAVPILVLAPVGLEVLGLDAAATRSMLFSALVVAQVFFSLEVRLPEGAHRPQGGWLGNRTLVLALVGSLALHLVMVTLPGVRDVFGVEPLGAFPWLLVAIAGVLPSALLIAAAWVRAGLRSDPPPAGPSALREADSTT